MDQKKEKKAGKDKAEKKAKKEKKEKKDKKDKKSKKEKKHRDQPSEDSAEKPPAKDGQACEFRCMSVGCRDQSNRCAGQRRRYGGLPGPQLGASM